MATDYSIVCVKWTLSVTVLSARGIDFLLNSASVANK